MGTANKFSLLQWMAKGVKNVFKKRFSSLNYHKNSEKFGHLKNAVIILKFEQWILPELSIQKMQTDMNIEQTYLCSKSRIITMQCLPGGSV